MSEPLKYKAEKGVSSYLSTAALAALTSWNFYEGQNPGNQTPPCVVTYATGQAESFPQAKPKDVKITIEIVSKMDPDQDADNIHGEATDRTTNWTAHRAAVEAIEAALQSDALLAHVNKGNVTNRPVSAFYCYDIEEDSQQSTMSGENRMLISIIGLTMCCEAQDN